MAGASALGVLRSSDGGATFEPHPLRLAVAFDSFNEGGVYLSGDGGESWTVDPTLPPGRIVHVAYSPSGALYAVHDGPISNGAEGVYRPQRAGELAVDRARRDGLLRHEDSGAAFQRRGAGPHPSRWWRQFRLRQ